MHRPALTKAQQRRLEKLAHEAGRTPQAMLRFVLRDSGACGKVHLHHPDYAVDRHPDRRPRRAPVPYSEATLILDCLYHKAGSAWFGFIAHARASATNFTNLRLFWHFVILNAVI